jgi:transcriptional regulator with XRE-family HTH domain
MTQSKLQVKTLDLIRNRPRKITLQDIAREAGVTVSWLKQLLKNDGIEHPSVRRIEAIYSYLSSKPLEV